MKKTKCYLDGDGEFMIEYRGRRYFLFDTKEGQTPSRFLEIIRATKYFVKPGIYGWKVYGSGGLGKDFLLGSHADKTMALVDAKEFVKYITKELEAYLG